jgi:hypothetical protein
MSILLILAAMGAILYVAGRVVYKLPKQDNAATTLVRAIAGFFMFLGAFLALDGVMLRLPNPGLGVLLSFAGALAIAILLRPRVALKAPVAGAAKPAASAPAPLTPEQKRRRRWIIGGVYAAAVLLTAIMYFVAGHSEGCAAAVQRAQASTVAVERLGSPIRKGWLVTGKTEHINNVETVDMSIPLSGPKGSGKLYAVGTKADGHWSYETLQLAMEGEAGRLDLLAGEKH